LDLRLSPAAPRRYRPRPLPTLAAVCGLAVFIHLGWWQYDKAVHSEAAAAQAARRAAQPPAKLGSWPVDAQAVDRARYTVRGWYDGERQFFVDNRQENGVPGVHVITPLRIDGSEMRVLVNRGWIGWPRGRGQLPRAVPPAGVVEVTGTAERPSTRRPFLIGDRPEPDPRLWPRIDLARFAQQSGLNVQPVVLLQDAGDAADGLVRHWLPPEDRSLKHRGYAFQWFAMALALLVFHTLASLRRVP
jgi:surfeit locus 1 family protein